MKKNQNILAVFLLAGLTASCSGLSGNSGRLPSYPVPDVEAAWIRNGESLVFEGEKWAPERAVEILSDDEVMIVGEDRGVQIFIEKVDIRPYNRLYTKFARNKFRIFKKMTVHD